VVVAAAEGGLMTTPPVKLPAQGALLEECLQNEERRLRALQDEGASWFRQFKQRRRIARGQRALEWADTRREGENPFMWGYGFKIGFGLSISTFIIVSFVGRSSLPITLDRIIHGAILAVALGSVGGFFGGLTEWGRRERELDETLAELLTTSQGLRR